MREGAPERGDHRRTSSGGGIVSQTLKWEALSGRCVLQQRRSLRGTVLSNHHSEAFCSRRSSARMLSSVGSKLKGKPITSITSSSNSAPTTPSAARSPCTAARSPRSSASVVSVWWVRGAPPPGGRRGRRVGGCAARLPSVLAPTPCGEAATSRGAPSCPRKLPKARSQRRRSCRGEWSSHGVDARARQCGRRWCSVARPHRPATL